MVLDDFFPGETCRRFLEEYFLKLPFSSAGGCSELTAIGTWALVEAVMQSESLDLLVVRDGQRLDVAGPVNYEQVREWFGEGCTILVRHAERHDVRLDALAAQFRRGFCAPVDIHAYCTPADHFGFGWHYDAEDVFILQTMGVKEYALRKNTVHPWPLVETLPGDMAYPAETMPLLRCTLKAGDWLYIPNGYWHKAQATTDSISLALGLRTAAAIEVLDACRPLLLDSLRWRQRIKVPGELWSWDDSQWADSCRALLAELSDDLQRILRSEAAIGALHNYLLRRSNRDDA